VVSTSPAGSDDPTAADARDDASDEPPVSSARGDASADVEPTPAARRREWRFPSDPSSITSMRWEVRGLLGDTGLSLNEIEDLVLAVSEAASNAVEHAQDPRKPFFDVSAEIDGRAVTIVVQDHGHWRRPTSDRKPGRGLAMMRALTDTSVATRPHGTTVTIRYDRAAEEGPSAEGERAS
jgi:anti-sigma regulatory factor (Ser/Thr protein kinase)